MLVQLKTKPLKLYSNFKREQIGAIDLFYYVFKYFHPHSAVPLNINIK